MNKSNQLTDRQEYRTPAVKIINVHSEGVICDSVEPAGINWFENDGDELDA